MKMKEFGPPGGGRVPGALPLDPPMQHVICRTPLPSQNFGAKKAKPTIKVTLRVTIKII